MDDGCIGETVASVIASRQLAYAKDPMVRRALTAVVREEATHAELAWKTVDWAVRKGGKKVESAVLKTFDRVVAETLVREGKGSGARKGHFTESEDVKKTVSMEAFGVLGECAARKIETGPAMKLVKALLKDMLANLHVDSAKSSQHVWEPRKRIQDCINAVVGQKIV
uniref:Ferritin-like domain-containing protein n=1 Tax=Lotharella oceanica TaxID=641309 RepID=A0A7S2TYQ5_9EUKA